MIETSHSVYHNPDTAGGGGADGGGGTSIAEGRPCDGSLTVTEDPHLASAQPLLPLVNDVSRVLHQRGSLVYLQLDQALGRQVEDIEFKGDVMLPSCRPSP